MDCCCYQYNLDEDDDDEDDEVEDDEDDEDNEVVDDDDDEDHEVEDDIYIMMQCLSVTKNEHFLKRSVCLFVMFYPHFFKSRK